MNRLRCLLLTLCVVALLIAPMYGQKSTGILTGTVTDPSGAVVANAPVTVTDTATGTTRSVTTNDQGAYSVPELQPAKYKVSVKAANFKEAVVNAVEINVATTRTLDIKLQLGKNTEQIEVEANAIQVQTDSAALGTVVDATQVSELPLNGRNFMGLTQLAPGVSTGNSYDGTGKGLKGGVDFSVNGNAVTNNLYLVDGANNNDRGSNRTILVYPSVDSIAEFKMLSNSYGAEYGQAAGSVITMVTKGGTNQFHGGVSYFGRNDALNAWDYFAKNIDTKGKLRYHDYGYHVGGPVLKDKLFFFWNQEWNKESRGIARTACVPTDNERAGDFSKDFTTIRDGNHVDQCGAVQPTAANVLPGVSSTANPLVLTSLSKVGKDVIRWFPKANQALNNGNNWGASLNSVLNWRQENARVDYNLTKNHVLMGRYTQDSWKNPAPGTTGWGDSIFPTLNSDWAQPSKMIIGKMTSTIGTTMVNDVEFSYSNNRINITAAGSDPGLLDTFTADVPTLYPLSYKTSKKSVPYFGWGGFQQYGSNQTFWMQAPWNNTLDMYSVRDDISKVSGAHTFKAGFLATFNDKNEDSGSPWSERPTFGMTNIAGHQYQTAPGVNPALDLDYNTGNGLFNVLEPGLVFNATETSTNVRALTRWRDYEFYFGDTWKARKNLTVELGIRYSLLFSPFQKNNKATSFQPWLFNANGKEGDACNGMWTVPGTDPCGDANKAFGTAFSKAAEGPNKYLSNQNYHLFAPRIGLAWDPTGTGNWAVRFGLGQFFQRDRVSPWYQIMNNAPFSIGSPTVQRTLDGNATLPAGGSASPSGGISIDSAMPNSWQWNLAVEHTFAKETALQVAYVGNTAIHQLTSYDINVPDPNRNINCNNIRKDADVAANVNWSSVPSWTCGAFNLNVNGGNYNKMMRPYGATGFGQLTYWDHSAQATYHSLQTVFRTKYKRSQFTAAYTYSHSIGNVELDNSSGSAGNQSYLYRGMPWLDRGNTPINRPHIFVANGTYFFPELKGSKGVVRNAFGGWEISMITQATSGHSVTVNQGSSENSANIALNPATPGKTYPTYGLGNYLGGLGIGTITPLVTGLSCQGGGSGRADQILDPLAFTLVGQQIGVVNPNKAPKGYCLGPRFINTDFSLKKNWKLTERFGMQLNVDFFDLFNHPNFNANNFNTGGPIATFNCGKPDANGKYMPCNPTNNVITTESHQAVGTFGNSTATILNHGRELQYGLKLTF